MRKFREMTHLLIEEEFVGNAMSEHDCPLNEVVLETSTVMQLI